MNKIIFPSQYKKRRYGKVHIQFFVDYLKRAGAKIELGVENEKVFSYFENEKDNLIFSFLIDGMQVLIDYSDHYDRNFYNEFPNVPIFKFQYYRKMHDGIENVFSLGPLLVYKPGKIMINEYFNLRNTFKYIPGDIVMNMQKPAAAALQRRNDVRNLLRINERDLNLTNDLDQLSFWKANRTCLAAICVPGARNDMLDRGQYELMGLGVCTISPVIKTILPWNSDLISGEHYVSCKDDYSNLLEKIKWCRENKQECKRIGDNVKDLFDNVSVPVKYFEWIKKKTELFYKN